MRWLHCFLILMIGLGSPFGAAMMAAADFSVPQPAQPAKPLTAKPDASAKMPCHQSMPPQSADQVAAEESACCNLGDCHCAATAMPCSATALVTLPTQMVAPVTYLKIVMTRPPDNPLRPPNSLA